MIDVLAWQRALVALPSDVAVVAFNAHYSANLPAIRLCAAGRCDVYLTPDNNFRMSCAEGVVVIRYWRQYGTGNTAAVPRPWAEIVADFAAVARSARSAP